MLAALLAGLAACLPPASLAHETLWSLRSPWVRKARSSPVALSKSPNKLQHLIMRTCAYSRASCLQVRCVQAPPPPAGKRSTESRILSPKERAILAAGLLPRQVPGTSRQASTQQLPRTSTQVATPTRRVGQKAAPAPVAAQLAPPPASVPVTQQTLPPPQLKAQPPRTQPEEELVYIFSYGGNMAKDTSRPITPVSRDPAYVVDPNIRMVFKHRGGHATLESLQQGGQPRFSPPASNGRQPCVHGVLYRIPKSQLKHYKNLDKGYIASQIDVETYDGLQVRASVFVSGPLSKLPEEVVPPEMYMRRLREGAAFNFLDPQYQAWLSSIETVSSAGLPHEYFITASRYISYSFLLVSIAIVVGYLSQHLA